jgi:hypothetical protein
VLVTGCRRSENQVLVDEEGLTDNCDLTAAPTWYGDADGDGFGGATFEVVACESPGENWVENERDCDDLDPSTNPAATEVCDDADNNCDGEVDEDAVDQRSFFLDDDGDGFGGETLVLACKEPEGAIDLGGDCDDSDAEVNPDAVEICNDGIDNDCDANATPCLERAGATGVVFTGPGAGARAGTGGGMAGDLNGDGVPDLVVNAYRDDTGGTDAGASYVFFGPLASDDGRDLPTADVAVFGSDDWRLGQDFAGEGDLDGDGIPDLVVGGMRSSGTHQKNGTTFVLHGPVLEDTDLLTDTGFSRIEGEDPWDRAGYSVRVLGDFNGDGIDDIALGAPFHKESSAAANAGAVYLVTGGFAPGSTVDLGGAQARFDGTLASENVGQTVGSGDLNGDGQADLLVGVAASLTAGGAVRVIWGTETPEGGVLADEDGILGDTPGLLFGRSVEGAGDINGDGYGDLLVGATGFDTTEASDAGAVYLIHGDASGLTVTSPADAPAVFVGAETDGHLGESVASGDWDGDGKPDLLLGADMAGPLGEGVAHLVVDGDRSGLLPVRDISRAQLLGELTSDGFGGFVNFADANNDGFDEIFVGADGNDASGSDAGRAYLLFDLGL